MRQHILTISLFAFLISATSVSANLGGEFVHGTGGKSTAAETFGYKYQNAKAAGKDAFNKFARDVMKNGSADEKKMFENMYEGKNPAGREMPQDKDGNPVGWNGDPNDPGPSDWSDYIVETDGAGNVTGFKEKNHYEMDEDGDGVVSDDERREFEEQRTEELMEDMPEEMRDAVEEAMDKDGDGKISNEERKEWNDNEENRQNGGPPGQVPPIADWDKNNDGKPDKGFQLWCWQCVPGVDDLDECHHGWPGNCDNNGSCTIAEMCIQANEVHGDRAYECHTCEYINDQPNPCLEKGLYPTPGCNSDCRPIDNCHAVHIDRNTGDRRSSTIMRSDLVCYECGQYIEEKPKCTDGLLDGVCDGHMCKDDEECKTVGDFCHVCLKKKPKCPDGTDYGKCNEYSCTSQQECIQQGECYSCKDKPPPPNHCESAEMYSGGCHGICDADEGCEESKVKGQVCHECFELEEEEEDDPCEKAELYKGGCPGACSDEEICNPRKIEGVQCHECEEKPEEEYECKDGLLEGACDGHSCKDDEECVQAGQNCHMCAPRTPDCKTGFTEGKCHDYTCASHQKCVEESGCFKCIETGEEEPKTCESENLKPGACPGTCDEGFNCSPIDLAGGVKCHNCYPIGMGDTCADHDLLDSISCNIQCESEPGYECKPVKKLGNEQCYECVSKYTCNEQGFRYGECDGHSCDSNEECVPAGKGCHQCVQKETETCATHDLMDSISCQIQCESEEGWECEIVKTVGDEECSKCVEKKKSTSCYYMQQQDGGCPGTCDSTTKCEEFNYDGGVKCHWCTAKTITEDPKCTDGLGVGPCPGDCHGEICVPAGEHCHTCREKQNCIDRDLMTFDDCSRCLQSGGKCVAAGRDDYDTPCYRCQRDTGNTCTDGYMPGGCNPYACPSNQTCHQANMGGRLCHACQLNESICPPGASSGQCGVNDTCQSNEECLMAATEIPCHTCRMNMTSQPQEDFISLGDPNQIFTDDFESGNTTSWTGQTDTSITTGSTTGVEQCPSGYSPGSCHGTCTNAEECFDFLGCHRCREKRCDPPLMNGSQCGECTASGGKCWPLYTLASSVGNAPLCYRCDYPESCEKYGQYSGCMECYPDEICIPGRRIQVDFSEMGGPSNGSFQCVQCMRPTKIEIEYYIYVIETPIGYVVLNKKLDKLKELAGKSMNVSSVMQLATSSGSGMQAVKSMLGGMGLDPLGILGGGMNIDQLSGLLQQGLEDKKNKFRDDCFENNFADQELDLPEQTPQLAADEKTKEKLAKKAAKEAKKKKKGDEPKAAQVPPAAAGEFGQDPMKEMVADAPAVACGTVDGEKALMVMDAAGNPVQTIFKEMLDSDPNAIMNAIQKAQSMSDKIRSIQKGGLKGMVDQLRQKAIAVAKRKVEDLVLGKKEEATAFSPNDQFYKVEKKKTKKLLGLLGSSTKGPKLPGGLRMGGKTAEEKKLKVADQWGIKRIGYLPMDDPNSAWNIYDGAKKNVLVAVIDSGFDFAHKDGPEYVWTNPGETPGNGIDDDENGLVDDIHGWNFIDNNNDLTDKKGHGTHVAGIIAAKRNNKRGIAGINPGAVIMPIKVADEEGMTNSLHVYQAINYAVNHGAQIINISIGGKGDSEMVRSALNYARDMGVFVAVASGNTGEYLGDVSPAKEANAFTVSAIDHSGLRSTIASIGPNNAIVAPGEEILSLRSVDSFHKRRIKDEILKQYFRQSGTSFSTPMVAATASLMLANNPTLTADKIEDILVTTAQDMGDEGWDDKHGAGLLDARAALSASKADGLIMKITDVRKNYDKKKKLESIDVFATVRGDLKDFTVNVGKGKHAKKLKPIAGPFSKEADHDWVTRIPPETLRGSSEWILNLTAIDKKGQTHHARMLLEL